MQAFSENFFTVGKRKTFPLINCRCKETIGIGYRAQPSRVKGGRHVKRRFSLLLLSGLLAFALVGCGGDDKNTGTTDGTDDMVTDQNDSVQPDDDNTDRYQDDGTADMDNTPSDNTNDDTLLDDLENGMNDLGDDVEKGIDDLEDMGTSYDQMVRNGSVHDTDGILTDGENAHTPGAA